MRITIVVAAMVLLSGISFSVCAAETVRGDAGTLKQIERQLMQLEASQREVLTNQAEILENQKKIFEQLDILKIRIRRS